MKPPLEEAARAIHAAFDYDPGHSDLDDAQPIVISTTLGAWRKLDSALAEWRKLDAQFGGEENNKMEPLMSLHLRNLPWRHSGHPPERVVVLVKGVTGMAAPRNTFIAFGVLNTTYHPHADDHWYDMDNDHFTDRCWHVTHWCSL